MAEAVEAARDQFRVDATEILRELHAIAFGDPRGLFRWGTKDVPRTTKRGEPIVDDDGRPVVDQVPYLEIRPSAELSPDAAKQIAGLSIDHTRSGVAVVNVSRADKLRALQLLGTHAGLFVQKIEHAGNVRGPIQLVVTQGEANA